MSLRVFKKDLASSGDLTQEKLHKVYDKHNLQSKSPLIEPMVRWMNGQLERHGKTMSPELVVRACEAWHNEIIRCRVKKVDPILEDITIDDRNYKLNPPTGMVFDDDLVIGVWADGRLHDLRLKHRCLCASKGWFFKCDGSYASPFARK